jgi:hypothetical protein
MKRARMNGLYLAGVILIALALAGCRGGEPEVDSAPFKQAIETYLRGKSMGMAVHAFKSISVEGDGATASVSLYAADVPQVKVRWRFVFAKGADGAWSVSSHKD